MLKGFGFKSVENREISYEVAILRQDRWVIERVLHDERQALDEARLLLNDEANDAVRVVRERVMPGGFTQRTPVLEERRAPKGRPALTITATPDENAVCLEESDLYGGPARFAIGQLFRAFLDRNGLTPTELLHDARHQKRLDSADSLLSAGLHRIAMVQAEKLGQTVPQRRAALEKMVDAVKARARDLVAMRRLPSPEPKGLTAMIAEIERLGVPPQDRPLLVRHAFGRYLEPARGLPQKLAMVASLGLREPTPAALPWIDELIADCAGSAMVVQELLGRQPSLFQALAHLADLAAGRQPPKPPMAPPHYEALSSLLSLGLPETRMVLIDRLRRELLSDKPLSRNGAEGEADGLRKLAERLADTNGSYLGESGMVAALVRRWRKLDLPGGLGMPDLCGGSAAERLASLLDLEKRWHGDMKKRALAALALDMVAKAAPEEVPGLAGLVPRIVQSELLPDARQSIAGLVASRAR